MSKHIIINITIFFYSVLWKLKLVFDTQQTQSEDF